MLVRHFSEQCPQHPRKQLPSISQGGCNQTQSSVFCWRLHWQHVAFHSLGACYCWCGPYTLAWCSRPGRQPTQLSRASLVQAYAVLSARVLSLARQLLCPIKPWLKEHTHLTAGPGFTHADEGCMHSNQGVTHPGPRRATTARQPTHTHTLNKTPSVSCRCNSTPSAPSCFFSTTLSAGREWAAAF